ncbi:Pilus assembly protein PilO [Candidatus Magnetomoraceae bacterium gMMP-15]
MKVKSLIAIFGLLIFVQLLYYNYIREHNIQILEQEINTLNREIRTVEGEKLNLTSKLKKLKSIIRSIPSSILVGFEDPETKFMEFLDYIQTSTLQDIEGEFSVTGTQTFKLDPVPLHETNFEFKFRFEKTYEAENFLRYLLLQKQYPLQVKKFSVNRVEEGKAETDLNVAFLIPAKIQLPSLSAKESKNK